MKELEMQNKTVKPQLDFGVHFDVNKHIRLVSPFHEEIDKYFLHFVKVAENLKCPKEH